MPRDTPVAGPHSARSLPGPATPTPTPTPAPTPSADKGAGDGGDGDGSQRRGPRGGWARLAAATAREAANRTTLIRIGEQPASPRKRLLESSQDLLGSTEFRLAATICERLLASNSYRRRQVGYGRRGRRPGPERFS